MDAPSLETPVPPGSLIAVPNISEGRNLALVRDVIASVPGLLLDMHSDRDHNRTVLTYGGSPSGLVEQMTALAVAVRDRIDLRRHTGVHPRLGALDVLPFVPITSTLEDARLAADLAANAIVSAGIPCVRYDETSLPDLRRNPGVAPHPTAGITAVGHRPPLIAFNVTVDAPPDQARRVARILRDPPRVRAIGLWLAGRKLSQVSMNLVRPAEVGPAEALRKVAETGIAIVDAEIVGLVPDDQLEQTGALPLAKPARSYSRAWQESSETKPDG